MRMHLLAFFVICSHALSAQTTQPAYDSARAILDRGELEKAIPYFETVMTNGDEALKRKTINYLTETWVGGKHAISLSKSVKSYGKLLSDYMSATFAGKESTMNAADHYTAGMIFWSFAYAGSKGATTKAVTQLNMAAQKGYSGAVIHLAAAVRQLKNQDPSIQWGDIINLYTQAAAIQKSPQPLIDLANSKVADLVWGSFDKKQTAAQRDTIKDVFFMSLYNITQVIPDSFHVAVAWFWERSMGTAIQDTMVSNLMKDYFARAPLPQGSPARKGQAWHHLYEYFYDPTPKNMTVRTEIMNKLKEFYNNEQELLGVISEFVVTAKTNDIGYGMSYDSKWLTFFTPALVDQPERLFTAAAMTDQDFLPFLEKNQPASRFSKPIADGYRKRFDRLFEIAGGKNIDAKYQFALAEVGSAANMRLIEKLAAYPEICKSSAIKQAYADLAVLKNLASYGSTGANIPIDFTELPKVYENWSAADKKSYNRQYVNLLLKYIQEVISSGRNVNSLASATGKVTLDFNDYDKAQKAITQISAALK
ncbi:hypothetical protein MKQ68_07565 [Chitinophaga horti]|uniref:DUF4034 domain-containing protein n=1 Tax=Chitinophaga horti TaxID=2920382 RepID=A0ABY6J5J3_9BACT|nr:hypothetical protein [Chitinophaga horti]UYQ94950.1 hypothetical protein MKQ68_07565 [Chitinophaga horti]